MAYVNVPKDLTKIKSKVLFNLTKRQLICFGLAALMGVPLFFLLKGGIGNGTSLSNVFGCGNGDDRCHAPRFSVWGV